MKDEIIDFAKSIGIEKLGFAKDDSGNSVIVALFPYHVKGERGNLSMYARCKDYHVVVRTKLQKVAGFLKNYGLNKHTVHVDNGGLNDREMANRAGLAFRGKNGLMICNEYGSYFFIGQLIIDIDIEPDLRLDKTCIACGKCIGACIGGALSKTGFDIEKCVSHISQKKGSLTGYEEKLIQMTGLCWGCDACQTVCPYNKNIGTTAMPEFLENRIQSLTGTDVSSLSNREFMRKYKEYAFNWRGRSVLERNLIILEQDKYEEK